MPYSLKYYRASGFGFILSIGYLNSMLLVTTCRSDFPVTNRLEFKSFASLWSKVFESKHLNMDFSIYIIFVVTEASGAVYKCISLTDTLEWVISFCIATHDALLKVTVPYKLLKSPHQSSKVTAPNTG